MSPESMVSTGLSAASKKPRCTVAGDALSSWIFSSLRADAAARTKVVLRAITRACDLMVSPPACLSVRSRAHPLRLASPELRRDLAGEQLERRQRLVDAVPGRIMHHDRGGA